jgi:hypothetical protein
MRRTFAGCAMAQLGTMRTPTNVQQHFRRDLEWLSGADAICSPQMQARSG